jgi:hypothetical protein
MARFLEGSAMTRHLFYAITLIGTGVLLNSPAEAAAMQCEDRAANCIGRCANPTGAVYQDKCMRYCERQVTSCLIRADERGRRERQ